MVVLTVGVYVNDLLIGGSEEDCESLLASLNKKFPTKNLGECTWYDGCCIESDVEHVESLMKQFDAQSISDIPASRHHVRAVARYAYESTERLWQAIIKILSYLNGTKNPGITYVRGSGLKLDVYAVADYANMDNDRRSVSGIAVPLEGTVVSHSSKTQRVVSLSTSEAE